MFITILGIILIVNLLEALYLLAKCWKLKNNNAPDYEYKQMVNKVAPLMSWTTIISLIILGITFILY
ncbi:MAG TPA: hypothetical protein VK115_09265 [Staphylococcus sp.]|nr:hypothetical protein [Staphylococcus sp.]